MWITENLKKYYLGLFFCQQQQQEGVLKIPIFFFNNNEKNWNKTPAFFVQIFNAKLVLTSS